MVDHTATARIERLVRWLEAFKPCFGHRAQLLVLRTYVQGVFSDSERKSMQAMLARVTEPIAYQAFQHFITHAPWDAAKVWRRLRAVIPERRGVAILDGLTPLSGDTFAARFWTWTCDAALGLLEVRPLVDEIRLARVTMLDGPQGLARTRRRRCGRASG